MAAGEAIRRRSDGKWRQQPDTSCRTEEPMKGNRMFETPFVMVGTIVTDPVHRRVGDHQVIKFRVASNSRRRTAEGDWEAGHSLFVNVNCWGRLVSGAAALIKGDPVVVVGTVHTSEYTDNEGIRRSSVEVRATAVGPDLARSTVRIEQRKRQEAPAVADDSELPAVDEDGVNEEDDDTEDDTDDDSDGDAGTSGLPLTA
jgi:single-strand DNA-binding protein